MVITLVVIAVFIISVVMVQFNVVRRGNDSYLWLLIATISFIACFFIALVIISNRGFANMQIRNNAIEREALVRRVECISSEYEDVSRSEVIKDVYEWNKKVYNAKYYLDNPFTSWFQSKKVVDALEYVYLEEDQHDENGYMK